MKEQELDLISVKQQSSTMKFPHQFEEELRELLIFPLHKSDGESTVDRALVLEQHHVSMVQHLHAK